MGTDLSSARPETSFQSVSALVLELKACCELDDARWEGRSQPSEVSAVNVEERQLLRTGDSEVGPVEHVEGLGAELQSSLLCQPNVLDNPQVPIKVARAIQESARQVADLS